MAQIIDYNDINNTLIDILNTANTTTATYDLSTDLDTRIKSITDKNLNIETSGILEYPIISVRTSGKTEEHAEFGNGQTTKKGTLNLQVFCVYDSISNVNTNIYDMVRNVETNLKLNIDLGGYNTGGTKIIDILPVSTSFDESFQGIDSSYNKAAKIDVEINFHSRDV